MKENGMGGHVARMGHVRNVYNFIGRHEGNRSLVARL